jgi:hypothetical protein
MTRSHPVPSSRHPLPLVAWCALLSAAVASSAQTTPPAAEPAAASGDTIELSPFTVSADNNGYYKGSSMSGTRFNTKLEEMGAPVSIMTKDQMNDFALVDINDAFLYMVGTEGIGTYSDFVMNRNGELTDNVSLSPSTANRVRGVGPANVSYGNFETMGRAPVDRLILESLEISRGPNANVFGLGNAAGTVNQVPVTANTTRHFARVEMQVDDWDGYRLSLDANRYLIKDKLALRFSALAAEEAFVRKPSGVETTRYNGFIEARPFKSTTINASYLYYKSEGKRPNYTPPRDYVSYWIQQGKPGWDPITQRVVMPNGATSGPYLTDAALFATPIGTTFNRTGGPFQRSNVFIDQDGPFYWTNTVNVTGSTPAANTGSGATTNPDGSPRPAGFIRLYGSSPGPNGNSGRYADQPLFSSVRSVTDSGLYDYQNINLAAPNFISDEQDTFYATLEQRIINTDNQLLALQVGFFREESERYRKVPIGDAGSGGQSGQLWVDVNVKNLDGTPNANFGRPYIGVGEPIYSYYPASWDTYRAQLAYQLDLTQTKHWTRWLGRHNLSPYYEYKDRKERKYSEREAIGSSHPWLQVGQPGVVSNFGPANQTNINGGSQAGPNVARPFYRFYVGDADGTNTDYAPGAIIPGSYQMLWGTIGNWRNEPTDLTLMATNNNTGGPNNLKRTIKTAGTVLQSFFLDGKLITIFGFRKDEVYAKQGAVPQQMLNNNTEHNFENNNRWEQNWREAAGDTKTMQFVVSPFRDIGSLRTSADKGNFFADLIQDMSFSYNQSDNFIPSPPAFDLYLNPLPNQSGEGKDFSLRFNLFNGKLMLGIIRYETKQLNARDGDANTIAQRVLRLDLAANDPHNLFNRSRDWYLLQNPGAAVSAAEAHAATVLQMDPATISALDQHFDANTLAAINDITAKGTEIEVNYNPNRYWTVSANFEERESINSNVSTTIQQWIDERMPIWTSIVDPITNPAMILGTDQNTRGWVADASNPQHLWWLHRYGSSSQSPSENYLTNVNSPWSILRETQGKSRPQIRRYAFRMSTNYQLAGITENRILKNFTVGGALRWEDKGAIGYYGVETYPATITALDPNRPIYDDSHFYVDLNASYQTRLFNDKVGATFRLNVRNVQESGRLQGVGAFPNGEIHSYRIIDPRQFILSAAFDF